MVLGPCLVGSLHSELLGSGLSYTSLSKVVSAGPWHRHENLIMACVMRLKTKESSVVCLLNGAVGVVYRSRSVDGYRAVLSG